MLRQARIRSAAVRLPPSLTLPSVPLQHSRWPHPAALSCRRSIHPTPGGLHGGHPHHPSDKHGRAASAPNKELETASTPAAGAAREAIPRALGEQAKFYFHKLRAVMHHYTLGTKLLWKNAKRYREIKKALPPDANGKPTDWVDASHLRRTRLDLSLGGPFVLVFALPFVGYVAPLFAVLAPRYIPSTFHTSVHVGTFLKEDARAGRQVLKRMMEQYGFHGQACSLSKFRELIRRIERGHGQVESLTDLVDLAGIMHTLTPNIASLPRAHLRELHQSLTHSSFLAQKLYTAKMLAKGLERWRETIWEDDQLLEKHGMERLTTAQVVEALYARGIYRHPLAMAYILQRTQHRALQSVDSSSPGKDDLSKPEPLQPPSPNQPTAAVVKDWRRTLQQWVELHRRVDEEASRRKAIEEEKAKSTAAEKAEAAAAAKQADQATTPTTASSTPHIHAAASATASVPSLTAESAPSSTNTAAASPPSSKLTDMFAPRPTGPAPPPPVFPMAFLLHVPALARAPQTIAPTDTPIPSPPAPMGETPEQADAKMLNEAAGAGASKAA